jgi:hypothetical protein
LTGERAKAALKDQIAASPEFAKNLQQPDVAGVQEDEELNDNAQGDVVVHDGIDSSKMINEEVEDLILQEPGQWEKTWRSIQGMTFHLVWLQVYGHG